MQYSLDYLTPLSIRFDEEATAYVVYRLPAPKRWQFRTYLSGPNFDDYTETEQEVSRVRVSLVIDEPTNEPLAIVVPFGPDGQEHAISAVTFRGVVSMVGVLAQMGFTPILQTN